MIAGTKRSKWASVALVLAVVITSFAGLFVATASSPSPQYTGPTIIQAGSMNTEASYIIFQQNANTFIRNGATGAIDFRSDNATQVFQYAIDHTSGVISVQPGNYQISATIMLDSDTTIIGNDASLMSTSDDLKIISTPFTALSGKTSSGIVTTGDDRSPLTANVLPGTNVLHVQSTNFVDVGEWIVIVSEEPWRNVPTSYDGELLQVIDKTSTTITLSSTLIDGYKTAYDATAIAIPMVHNITLSGLNFIGKDKLADGYGLYLARVIDAKVSDCDFLNNGAAHITVYDSQRVIIDRCTFIGTQPLGLGYGVQVVAASNMVTISNSYFYDCKHGFTTGQATYGVPRHILVQNCLFDRTYERQHSVGEFITIDSCRFQYAIIRIETPNSVIQNSEILGRPIRVGSDTGTFVNVTNTRISGNYISTTTNNSAIQVFLADGLIIQNNNINLPTFISGAVSAISLTPPPDYDSARFIYRNIQIIGNQISSENYGININPAYLNGKTMGNILISSNSIVSKGICIRLNPGASTSINGLAIQDNILSPSNNGIHAIKYEASSVVPYSIIEGNTIYAKDYAIEFNGYSNGTMISGNTVYGGYIYLNSAQSVSGTTITGNSIIQSSGICIYATKQIANLLIEKNYLKTNSGASSGAIHIAAVTAADNIRVLNNDIINSGTRGVRIDGASNVRLAGNVITSSVPYYVTSGTRVTYEGVGTNGANDPASAGEWYQHGYEGVLVKWNNGGTNYISSYVGGGWVDWTVT